MAKRGSFELVTRKQCRRVKPQMIGLLLNQVGDQVSFKDCEFNRGGVFCVLSASIRDIEDRHSRMAPVNRGRRILPNETFTRSDTGPTVKSSKRQYARDRPGDALGRVQCFLDDPAFAELRGLPERIQLAEGTNEVPKVLALRLSRKGQCIEAAPDLRGRLDRVPRLPRATLRRPLARNCARLGVDSDR